MVSARQLLDVGAASVLLIVVPGPSVLFIVGRTLSHGRRVALASLLGNSGGALIAAATIAVGLGPILERSDAILHVIKLVGVAYLLFLGVQAFRHADTAEAHGRHEPALSTSRALRTGLTVGMTNPKSFIIFGAVLPQFVERSRGGLSGQMLALALVPITIGLVTDSLWLSLAGRARSWLSSSPRRARNVGRAGGLALIALGVSTAAESRGS